MIGKRDLGQIDGSSQASESCSGLTDLEVDQEFQYVRAVYERRL